MFSTWSCCMYYCSIWNYGSTFHKQFHVGFILYYLLMEQERSGYNLIKSFDHIQIVILPLVMASSMAVRLFLLTAFKLIPFEISNVTRLSRLLEYTAKCNAVLPESTNGTEKLKIFPGKSEDLFLNLHHLYYPLRLCLLRFRWVFEQYYLILRINPYQLTWILILKNWINAFGRKRMPLNETVYFQCFGKNMNFFKRVIFFGRGKVR